MVAGAGRYPTANSVVNDIVRLARGLVGKPFPVERQVGRQAGTHSQTDHQIGVQRRLS